MTLLPPQVLAGSEIIPSAGLLRSPPVFSVVGDAIIMISEYPDMISLEGARISGFTQAWTVESIKGNGEGPGTNAAKTAFTGSAEGSISIAKGSGQFTATAILLDAAYINPTDELWLELSYFREGEEFIEAARCLVTRRSPSISANGILRVTYDLTVQGAILRGVASEFNEPFELFPNTAFTLFDGEPLDLFGSGSVFILRTI